MKAPPRPFKPSHCRSPAGLNLDLLALCLPPEHFLTLGLFEIPDIVHLSVAALLALALLLW